MEIVEIIVSIGLIGAGGYQFYRDNGKFGQFIGVPGLLRKCNRQLKIVKDTLSYAQVHYDSLPENSKADFKLRFENALSSRDQAMALITKKDRTSTDLKEAGILLERALLEAELVQGYAAEAAYQPSMANLDAIGARSSAGRSAANR